MERLNKASPRHEPIPKPSRPPRPHLASDRLQSWPSAPSLKWREGACRCGRPGAGEGARASATVPNKTLEHSQQHEPAVCTRDHPRLSAAATAAAIHRF